MWNFIVNGTIVLFCLLGIVAGLGIGSIVLEKSTLVRPGDWMECMVGYPVIGVIVLGFIGVVVADHLDSYFIRREKRNNALKVKADTPTQFLVFGHTDNGRGIVVEVTALNGAEALEKAKQERPNCKFNHVNLK